MFYIKQKKKKKQTPRCSTQFALTPNELLRILHKLGYKQSDFADLESFKLVFIGTFEVQDKKTWGVIEHLIETEEEDE